MQQQGEPGAIARNLCGEGQAQRYPLQRDERRQSAPRGAEQGGEDQQPPLRPALPAGNDETGQSQIGQCRQTIADGGQEEQGVGHGVGRVQRTPFPHSTTWAVWNRIMRSRNRLWFLT